MSKPSRLPGFYKQSVNERLATVATATNLTDEERETLGGAAVATVARQMWLTI